MLPNSWTGAGESFAVLLSMYLLGRWMFPVGGFIFGALMAPHMIPGLGRAYHFLIQGPIKLLFPIKVTSWLVSGSGTLLGWWAANELLGSQWMPWHTTAALIASTLTFLAAGSKVLEFTVVPPTHEILDGMKRLGPIARLMERMDSGDTDRLARTYFVDMLVSQLFGLLTAGGLVFYTMGQLGLLELAKPSESLTIWSSMLVSWSMGTLFGASEVFTGTTWVVVRATFQLCLFLWLTVFLQLGTSLLDRDTDRGSGDSSEVLRRQEAELKLFINTEVERLQNEKWRASGLNALERVRSVSRLRPCRPRSLARRPIPPRSAGRRA
jgi:hypothetical protein